MCQSSWTGTQKGIDVFGVLRQDWEDMVDFIEIPDGARVSHASSHDRG